MCSSLSRPEEENLPGRYVPAAKTDKIIFHFCDVSTSIIATTVQHRPDIHSTTYKQCRTRRWRWTFFVAIGGGLGRPRTLMWSYFYYSFRLFLKSKQARGLMNVFTSDSTSSCRASCCKWRVSLHLMFVFCVLASVSSNTASFSDGPTSKDVTFTLLVAALWPRSE